MASTVVKANKPYNLAGTSGLQSDPFWISMTCGGTKAAQAAGATMTWKSASNTTESVDQANVDAVKLLNPDGVVISIASAQHPTERTAFMKAGVPVVETNSISTDSNYYQAVTAYPQGKAVTDFGALIGKATGGTGSFAVLGGQPGIPFLESVWKPITDELPSLYPNLKILPTQYDNFDTNQSASVVSALIVAHPDLKAIYTISGPEGTGAVTAVKQAGMTGKILIFSGSGDADLVADLKTGSVAALLSQSPYLMGQLAVQSLITYLNNHTSKTPVQQAAVPNVAAPTMILTKDNVSSAAAQAFQYQSSC